jgi:hypothetical protein
MKRAGEASKRTWGVPEILTTMLEKVAAIPKFTQTKIDSIFGIVIWKCVVTARHSTVRGNSIAGELKENKRLDGYRTVRCVSKRVAIAKTADLKTLFGRSIR